MKALSEERDELMRVMNPWNHFHVNSCVVLTFFSMLSMHSYDILGARMLWKPKEARILTNFIDQPV
jgi:hypothetical protein